MSASSSLKTGKGPGMDERQMLLALYADKQFTSAASVAQAMTRQYPRHGFGWKVLGAALRQMGQTAASLAPMQKAVQLMPTDHEAFNNLGVTLRALNKLEQAVGCFKRAIELKPDYADAVGNLGAALLDQGKPGEALAAFQRRIRLSPDDEAIRHQIAALTGVTTKRAPDKYVEGVFDDYADRFESHLQGVLKYDVPRQLADMAHRQMATPGLPGTRHRLLDLGCGTGLMGKAAVACALAGEMIGVDLSAKMLAKADASGLYQRLVQSDLLSMLEAEAANSYDLAFAADVFVYLGRLDEVVAQVARVLCPGGLFGFSIESGSPASDYDLQSNGRYRQSLGYLERMAQAQGFTILESVPTVIRMDNLLPVSGHALIWRR